MRRQDSAVFATEIIVEEEKDKDAPSTPWEAANIMESVLRGPQGRRRPHLICISPSVDDAFCKEFSQIGWGLDPEFLSTSE